jgi:hypothetical protein
MDNPEIPEAFRSVLGMGAQKVYFRSKTSARPIGTVVGLIILFGGSGLTFVYGVYEAYIWSQRYGPVMIQDKLTAPLIIAIILFLLGLVVAWSAYNNRAKGVLVYERGFAYRDRKGVQAWRWEDMVSLTSAVIRHYTNGIYTGTTHAYTLYNRQNVRLVLNDVFAKVEELAKVVEQNIFPLLYAQVSAQYNGGQTVVFGPVSISKTGIQIFKKTYPWAEVKEVSIQKGILRVSKKDGGWFSGASASVSGIPNLRVLLSIIDQVVGIKAG